MPCCVINKDLSIKMRTIFISSTVLFSGVPTTAALAVSSPTPTPHRTQHHRTHINAQHPEAIHISRSRTQRFHSTPATVNVMSGKELRELNITGPKDIAAFTPGVTAVNATSGSTPIFSVRGIGLDDYTGNNMGGIGIYQDGVFAPYPVFYTGQMFDTQMVSVEKGPQGFDYGRSSTGGNLAIESTRPGHHFGGYIDWGYSSYGTNTARAAVDLPINDKILNRTAFSYINGDGWQHDIHTGHHYGSQDQLGLRNLTQFLIDDQSSLLLNVHYTRDRGTPLSPQDTNGDSVNGYPDRTIGIGPNGRYNEVNVGTDRATRNENGGGFSIGYTRNFTFGTFTSTTGLDLFRRKDYDNYDGESLSIGDYHWNDTTIAQSHDMHFQTTLAKRIHVTTGIYESFDKINGSYTSFRSDLPGLTQGGNLTNHFVQQNISTGLYLNTVTNIIHGLDFIASGRFSYDDRGYKGGTIDDGGAFTTAGTHISYLNEHHRYDRLTGRVGLRYTIVPGTLIYGTISNGYKAGSYFAGAVSAPEAQTYVRPENMIAYEIGIKTSLLHDKIDLEGSLFDYEYHNRQTLFVAQMPATTSLTLGSIPRARTRGGEISSTFHNVIPNLDLRSSFAYLDARTISAVDNVQGLPLLSTVTRHSALPFAPRFSWNAVARYNIDLSTEYHMVFQASYTWKDNMLLELGDPNGNSSKISSMGLRMEFGPKTGKWTAAVYVDNLLNRHGNSYSYTGNDNSRVQYIQAPRWIGGNIRYNF